jgi:hypothetical protein
MEMKKKALILVGIALVLGLAVVYLWGPSTAPTGQEPISTLTAANFNEFEATFDSASGGPRLIVLVSPT